MKYYLQVYVKCMLEDKQVYISNALYLTGNVFFTQYKALILNSHYAHDTLQQNDEVKVLYITNSDTFDSINDDTPCMWGVNGAQCTYLVLPCTTPPLLQCIEILVDSLLIAACMCTQFHQYTSMYLVDKILDMLLQYK